MVVTVPPGSESHVDMRVGCYLLFAISTSFLLTRVYIRFFMIKKIGVDDVFVILAWICNLATMIAVKFMFEDGIGYHAVDIGDPAIIIRSVLWPWVTQFLYYFGISAIKVSVVAFYLRLAVAPIHRKILWALFVLIFCQGLSSGLTVAAFLCHPIDLVWKGGVGGPNCINILTFNYYNAAFHIVIDILLAIAPIIVIRGLQMDKAKKIALSAMFSLGALAIAGTIARQVTNALALTHIHDFTWFWAAAELCTVSELSLGIIFASVPALQPLLARYLATISHLRDNYYSKRDGVHKLDDKNSGAQELVTIGKIRNTPKLRPEDSILCETVIVDKDEGDGGRGDDGGSERRMIPPPDSNGEKRKSKIRVRVEQGYRVDYSDRE